MWWYVEMKDIENKFGTVKMVIWMGQVLFFTWK